MSGDVFLMLHSMGYEAFYGKIMSDDKECARQAFKSMGIDGVDLHRTFKPIHELEHLIMNPRFNLAKSSDIPYSLVESLIEEIWLHNIRGYAKEIEKNLSEGLGFLHPHLVFGNSKTIGEAINRIAMENFSTPARNKTKESIVYDLLNCFYERMDEPFREGHAGDDHSCNRYSFSHALVRSAQRQFSFSKKLIEDEQATLWRRFCLHMKLAVMKKAKRNV